MKQLQLLFIICFLTIGLNTEAQSVKFKQKSLKKVYKKASKKGKLVFVDVYADWCGPCKMMDREVFSRSDVGEYMNDHYISFKMDADDDKFIYEKFEYDITKLPSLLFLNPNGELLQKYEGSTTGSKLLSMAKSHVRERKD